ncbi:hypothetical protein CUMW_174280 [Citrus unshiu]|uniref:Uncharacterized protein n=1 Tax=Citrus unshiu TaxID=55188 RepID=A0A2H5PWL2_CITUN|nr:hypothetical protein CUMW_174280 [Citrus unshiu]
MLLLVPGIYYLIHQLVTVLHRDIYNCYDSSTCPSKYPSQRRDYMSIQIPLTEERCLYSTRRDIYNCYDSSTCPSKYPSQRRDVSTPLAGHYTDIYNLQLHSQYMPIQIPLTEERCLYSTRIAQGRKML